jgi:hypothetical protein
VLVGVLYCCVNVGVAENSVVLFVKDGVAYKVGVDCIITTALGDICLLHAINIRNMDAKTAIIFFINPPVDS